MSFSPALFGETPFSVIDIEATGIYPSAHDRIIEIAIVRVSPLGDIIEEYATLVNPRRDIGRRDVHGISAGDVLNAPEFAEIASDVGHRLCGSIVVGHNLRFDLGFLTAEFSRIGITMPQFPSICTLGLTYKIFPEIPSRKLTQCCDAAGIHHEHQHSALGDARATAALLAHYLEIARQAGVYEQISAEIKSTPIPLPIWLPAHETGRIYPRNLAAENQDVDRRYLARLVERMVGDEASNARDAEYLLLLDRALEDRLITRAEAEGLVATARDLGMTRSNILDAHRTYLANLASEAFSDGTITGTERRDLESVCDMLDLNRAALDEVLAGSPRHIPQHTENFSGMTVCFTGELLASINGNRVTRTMAEAIATSAGLIVQPNVTRTLDILIVADPNTQSGKAKKARGYEVRILAEASFWRAIHAPVD